MRRGRFYAVAAILHISIIILISCRDVFRLVAVGETIVSGSSDQRRHELQPVSSNGLDQRFERANPYGQLLAAYIHLAGIEAGYSFFGPNIPDSYKLVFELHYPDGHIGSELPQVANATLIPRMAGLLDKIGRTQSEPFRRALIEMLAYAEWREHPDATMIRTVLGSITLPSPDEFRRGKRESYQFLYAYDFTVMKSP
jgi:hypothetical protein